MATELKKSYLLGDYRLETDKQVLSREGQRIHLPKRPFQVLLYLIEHRDEVVSRDALLDRFWDGKDVYDDALRKCVGSVRKALGDHSERPRFIETRYAGGYRFIGPVEEQLLQARVVAGIERTRGVKIIIDEEEVLETGEPALPIQSPAATLPIAASRPSWRSVALAVIAIALTASALIAFRSRAGSIINATPSAPALVPINSIAALPLKNLSGDPAQEYFSDGLTESVITELSKIKGLKVTSRSSVFTFKGKEVDPREVGQRLGVAAVLEGSVRKNGDNVRVEVRLVSTEDGRVLWATDSYDRTAGDIFAIQDEIARGVTSGLKLNLNGAADEKITHHYTVNRDAYDAYLKGRYYWNERTIPRALDKARASFEDAVQRDPNYALAYSGLADSFVMSFWYTPMSGNEAFIKARLAAEKAVQLDDTLSEAHTSLAAVAEHEWNWQVAQREYERALDLDPNYATAHHWYALYLLCVDKPEQAIAEIQRARESDPLSPPINADVGYVFYWSRRYDEAIAEYKKALEMKPDFPMALQGLAETYVKSGKPKEAVELMARLPDDLKRGATAGYIYGSAGERDEARKILAAEMQRSKREYVSPTNVALVYIGLGDREQALSWLEKAYREHSPYLSVLREPIFDEVRSDPRFVDLANRVGP
jgi:TolB-like protein/DNA-binding winged helix-turn-helix (wHTH) protein/Tfp pilus assembly protein PilF